MCAHLHIYAGLCWQQRGGQGYGGTGVSLASIQFGLSIMQRQFLYFLYTTPFEQIWVFKFVGCNTQIPADWPIINNMCAHFAYLRWPLLEIIGSSAGVRGTAIGGGLIITR
jgi:hypothetical protein